ncbi:hypothetical protein HYE66_09570 [Aggregatibacter actinomycetemcomitans]|nr:hypothetical protein [Aggregatibacter actinomycetemcomitans]
MINDIVIEYIRIYLNFRTNLSSVSFGKWSLEKDTVYDDLLDVSFYLFLKSSNNLPISKVKKKVYKELLHININDLENVSAIINSFLDLFYLPMQGVGNHYNFIHYKAISFFQLSMNYPASRKNDYFRLKYIRLLLSNSYLYHRVNLVGFKCGALFFNKIKLRDTFYSLLCNKGKSDVFYEVVKYCLSVVDFMENGIEKRGLVDLFSVVDDIYLENSHYKNFICSKSYKYKFAVRLINEMYQYPKDYKSDFVNRMYLINFYFLSKKASAYFEKYIKDKKILDKVIRDFDVCFSSPLVNKL